VVCAPNFVLEVLSSSSASHDQIRKRRVYERAGVTEYWILHPADGVLTIYRRAGVDTSAMACIRCRIWINEPAWN